MQKTDTAKQAKGIWNTLDRCFAVFFYFIEKINCGKIVVFRKYTPSLSHNPHYVANRE